MCQTDTYRIFVFI
ncbi:hypothetical protein E2986_11845 [Frieseomelitta varia]|uniref:Uncharacterized protein n=1 Tax=Frieseomelitta varia TaxID=561572 RepID=A0A833W7P9_9HYME|nr:hypothetical protein E2986_11845 [Frieseomelitta varia]